MPDFTTYFKALKQYKPEEVTEHTHRATLENLLNGIKAEQNPQIKIIHEPKRIEDYGAPDFKLILHEGILGYVENKALGVNLEEILKSDQISRYKKLSNNIVLTNYLDWIWLKDGKIQDRASLCALNELQQPRFKEEPAQVQKVLKMLSGFLSTAPEGIGNPQTLAKALGQRGQLLKTYLLDELRRQEREDNQGKLFGLFNIYKRMVDHELTLEDFTDTFAQMLVYGLFMARLNSAGKKIDLFNVERYIPTSFELIHELVSFLKELDQKQYSETRWIVEEVLAVLNTMDLGAITALLSFDKHNKKADPEIARDPYIYFYEDFLAAYDKALKKARGVYYTPPPVVNFIIRAVNDVLKDTFNIKDGLADHKRVTLLDFACGTGTFLLEAIRLILDETPPAKRELIVKEHILKNLYGFEYMIAPYTVAHLKLTQYLKDRGYELNDNERLKVFLTNTLEHFEIEDERLLPALSTESKKAKGVKDKPILVITGNPPYSYVSKNNGDWIKGLVKDYYYYDGQPLGERNPKALQDDYVKFIRFAQWKIDQEDEGIVAIITNHSFLDSPTLRGMRQSLAKTFNQMYFVDLHGNTKRKEKAPDGGKDENVFDIMQGVGISILIKNKCGNFVKSYDIYGLRCSKYSFLNNACFYDLTWTLHSGGIETFKGEENTNYDRYLNFVSLSHIFRNFNIGISTSKDSVTIRDSVSEITQVLKCIAENSDDKARKILKTGDDISYWSISKARSDLISSGNYVQQINQILYRPFDCKYTYYSGISDGFISRPRYDIMRHLLKDNVALIATRINRQISTGYFFVSEHLVDRHLLDNAQDATYVMPLYQINEIEMLGSTYVQKDSNINTEIPHIRHIINANNNNSIIEEIIFGYIYSILHSPTYREKYKDFLKTDFPRIPFCEEYATFEALSALGWRLINAHLMKSDEPRLQYPQLGQYQVPGGNVVEKVFYTDSLQRLNINDRQYFAPVPEELYTFHIGGYQVLNKYLKDRKGRNLSLDEIENVENIVRVLAFTRDIMQEIDVRTRDWI